jgi:hypothetical protein
MGRGEPIQSNNSKQNGKHAPDMQDRLRQITYVLRAPNGHFGWAAGGAAMRLATAVNLRSEGSVRWRVRATPFYMTYGSLPGQGSSSLSIHWSSYSNVEPDHGRHGFVCRLVGGRKTVDLCKNSRSIGTVEE